MLTVLDLDRCEHVHDEQRADNYQTILAIDYASVGSTAPNDRF